MYQVVGSRLKARDIVSDQMAGRTHPAGDCLHPVEVRYRGLPDQVMVGLGREKDLPAIAYINVRCRMCEHCLNHRRRLWTARAIAECAVSGRTWFGTLTLRPEERIRFLYAAQLRRTRSSGDNWHDLSSAEQFRYLVDEVSPEITKFLKRVRAKSGSRLRYFLVSEEHKDGFPHFHLLLHELEGRVMKRELDGCWRVGFSQFRLIPVGDPKGARYACKYLSKSALTRVRASQRYGQAESVLRLASERLQAVSGAVSGAHASPRAPVARPVPSVPKGFEKEDFPF